MTDWLNEFPLPDKPDSWALNPIFLQKLKEMENLWRAEGYRLQWGKELEFIVHESEAVKKALKGKKDIPGENIVAPLRKPGPYKETLKELRAFFKTEDGQALLLETGQTYKEALAYIRKFERGLKSEDPKIVSKARENIFLAHIHTRSFDNGGVRDLIEPRFGDKEYGIGWNDRVPEIRTRILGSVFNLISSHHKYLAVLNEQAKTFGLTVETTDPQYHLSIIRLKDNKNMMKMEDEESIAFCERALGGYHAALQALSFMVLDYQLLTPAFDFDAGTTRNNHLRIEPDNWEFRRGQQTKQAHAARSLMVILMGMTYGCLYHPDLRSTLPIEKKINPLVKHVSNPLSGLASAVEHCAILPDGRLQPDMDVLKSVLWRLTDEIGIKNLDTYRAYPPLDDHIYYSLSHPYAWHALLSKLHMTPDNQLDLSSLDDYPKIKSAFEQLNISGRRTSLHVTTRRIDTELHTLEKNIRDFFLGRMSRLFFSPQQQIEIASLYWQNPIEIHKEAGDNAVKLLREGLPGARKSFEKLTRIIPKSVTIPVAELFLSNRIYVTNLLYPAMEVDCENGRIEHLRAIIRENAPVSRDVFLRQPSYFSYLKNAFLDGMDRHILELSKSPHRNKRFMVALETCKLVFNGKASPPGLDSMPLMETMANVQAYIKGFTKNVISGDTFREHGADIETLQNLCRGSSLDIYGFLIMALQEPNYKESDIVKDIDELCRAVDTHFIACDGLLEKAPDRALTRSIFKYYKELVVRDLSEIQTWAHQNLASPYPALPAPQRMGTHLEI